MNTTTLLMKSIGYEQSKSSVFNLLNHGHEDLSLAIEVFDKEKRAIEISIQSNQYLLDNCADEMAEGLQNNMRAGIAKEKQRLETLLAWRAIFWAAWEEKKSI